MSPKLSVAVQVDLDGRHVTLRVTAGALTVLSQQGLHAVIGRSLRSELLLDRELKTKDLVDAAASIATAFAALRQALEDPGRTGRGGVVRLVMPIAARTAAIGAGTGPEVAA